MITDRTGYPNMDTMLDTANLATALDMAWVLQLTAADRRQIRDRAGLSRPIVAQALRCSIRAIENWETGCRQPRGHLGAAYAQLLRELDAA